jgi:hypothetical protein
MRHTKAMCRPCFDADTARQIQEGRELARDVPIAPSFEELGCWE